MTLRPASKLAIASGLVAVYVLWGSTFLGIRVAVETLPPLLSAAARFLVAGGILFAWALARGARRPTLREWRTAGFVGLGMLTFGNGSVVWAEGAGVKAGVAALVVACSPIWLVVFDWLLYRNRVDWAQGLGVVIGLCGMFILVNPGTSPLPLFPAVILIGGCAIWAVGTLGSRSKAMHSHSTMANGLTMLAGAGGLALVGLAAGEGPRLATLHPSGPSLLALAYLVVFGSLLAFSCYLWLLRVAPVPLVSTQSYVSPVIAVVFGALLLDERVNGRELVAGAVILSSVVLTASAPLLTRRRAREQLSSQKAA